LPEEYFHKNLASEVLNPIETAIKKLESLGAKLKKISLPNTCFSVAAYYVIAPAEASSNLSRFDGVRFGYRADNLSNLDDLYFKSRSVGFGKEVKRRILVGTFVLSHGYYDAYYLQALRVRRLIISDFDLAFKECDFIVSPTSPSVAWDCDDIPELGEMDDEQNNVPKEYLSDIFTVGVSLAGLPAISIPCGFGKNKNTKRPVGLQIIGKRYSEAQILQLANIFQNETNWHNLTPQNKD
jgi:aspartyl-tRNA(Asn)/glutamyl-tRNA(Gln) amidotransferase subunit A